MISCFQTLNFACFGFNSNLRPSGEYRAGSPSRASSRPSSVSRLHSPFDSPHFNQNSSVGAGPSLLTLFYFQLNFTYFKPFVPVVPEHTEGIPLYNSIMVSELS